ncbi:MarR family winged helix-turn-helix transcriptional regulator [Bacillus benzoevorans]|uniref:DNA-binding MarR family transcriptional regulator n=1 Tax=Bacillus benzoevorans TaxID=1456 RepID=A0A7X0HUF9_9BACI|nr:MarR family transcriptional regulator [Bacillus benzoevorans]MBB6447090.1 DNA-binding MarR family transcriptional regulator [Bacillus benzoevorans]
MEGFFQRYLSLYRKLITELNALMSPYELSYSLWLVLYYVKNNGPSTLVEISNYYQVEKPTITRRVQRLEDMKMVEQIPGKDKREKVMGLTALGEEVYQECRKKITDLENSIMEGISEKDQLATFQTLPKIRENIIKSEGNKCE